MTSATWEPITSSRRPFHPSSFVLRPSEKEGERMHRTTPWFWGLLGALLGVLAGEAIPARLGAQTCSPEPRPLVVLLNGTVKLQMRTKKRIRAVSNPKETVLAIRTVEGDPTSVILAGTAPGVTHVELEDTDGVKEVREVV